MNDVNIKNIFNLMDAIVIHGTANCDDGKPEHEYEFPELLAFLLAQSPTVLSAQRASAERNMSPQCKLIFDYLKQGNTITQRSALLDFGVMSLPRRISDLKEHHNINIKSTMEHNKLTGQRYARYSLEKVA